jgi:hypothetical protein
MDIKDKAYLKGKLREEFEQIQKTEFWKDYIARLEDERNSAVSHCLTDSAEDVPRYQGAVRAIKTIEGLPSKVLEVAPKKSS